MLQVVKETVSNYNTFINDITEMVKVMMGEDFSIRIYKVTKNNSLELDSLVILKKGNNFTPNIYLLPYYEAYMQGVGIQELAKSLCSTYRNNSVPSVNENFTYLYDDIKPYIIYRLVSYQRNKKLLEKIPHIKFLDMAITFHCLVQEDNDAIGTIRITNEHMQMWETSLQELNLLAVNNTNYLFPPVIKSMDEVILGMLKEEYMNGKEDDLSDKMLDRFINNNDNPNEHKMYILSNQKGINGATCLLYENVLNEFADKIHSDFFILPSSIHEVIFVPYDKTITKEALADMVRDVNYTQVARDEVLSDQVYFYSRENNTISM
ncbi:MAG: DUF5688 family protein [Herbinix sp.]|nr:DUF5688 family protein [Herbinix sp.]